ncbi:Glycoside hydrolase [Phytophthora palmivora]|uniref:Glycoside hydrolase n=1 Tax=Phytophthora palmivora TaxID=4796 RepID=A0A2P4YQX1_9STRA|nr:Glycoside hydrolase [Phytophthora palmivora]
MPLSQILVSFSLYLGLWSFTTASDARCFPSNFQFGAELHDYNVSGVERVSAMGLSSVQFSMSWSRVMQWNAETNKMQVNREGVEFYHTLLNELQVHGLQAAVTLSHFDLPSTLQDGWLHSDIVTHFEAFASLAFNEYGHRVKFWVTFNEPLTFINGGYGSRNAAEGVKSSNDYTVAHNVLCAHARAVALFRELKQQDVVDASARIGIELNAEYGYPVEESNARDVAAVERKMQFDLGWFLMPLVTGDYPGIMRKRVGKRLPQFSREESALIKGSYDVLMLNHYNSRVVTDCDSERSEITCDKLPQGHARDRWIDDTRARSNTRARNAEFSSLADYSDDYMATIKWLHAKDPSTEILLTENIWCDNDQLQANMKQMYKAVVEENIPIIGYSVSFLDTYDTVRTGQNYSKQGSVELTRNLAHLSTTKCLDDWSFETTLKDSEEKKAAEEIREKQRNPEGGSNGVSLVPWSLNEVVLLVVVGLAILGAITCEAMRELRLSSQGSPEELQVLITIED